MCRLKSLACAQSISHNILNAHSDIHIHFFFGFLPSTCVDITWIHSAGALWLRWLAQWRLHAWFTCYHAWDDEWEYNHLQHPHQELSREAKVLLVEMGKRCKLSDQDAQSDSWKIRSLIEPFGNKTNLQTVDVRKNSCRKTNLNSDVFITSIF